MHSRRGLVRGDRDAGIRQPLCVGAEGLALVVVDEHAHVDAPAASSQKGLAQGVVSESEHGQPDATPSPADFGAEPREVLAAPVGEKEDLRAWRSATAEPSGEAGREPGHQGKPCHHRKGCKPRGMLVAALRGQQPCSGGEGCHEGRALRSRNTRQASNSARGQLRNHSTPSIAQQRRRRRLEVDRKRLQQLWGRAHGSEGA
mmetsp:Transcript_78493/g.233888  ORF Transcript_78493/g.233888 Transcript_78493/m.233888 type:complete len:202 (+) Transcript_78493:305-910(+)